MNRGKELIEFIHSVNAGYDCIRSDDRGYWVATEWLVGPFAGRSFHGDTDAEAAEKMARYFDEHKGHPSMVGQAVTESGWPDLNDVRLYVLGANAPDDGEGQADG